MDAFELTHPVLSSGRTETFAAGIAHRRAQRIAARRIDPDAGLAAARRFTYQLPLGSAPRPFEGRVRGTFGGAATDIEQALWGVALAKGVVVDVDERPMVLACRLMRVHAIVPPAVDAVQALLPILEAGAAGNLVDLSVETAAAKLAERLVGYLDSRAA
jgi:hypothetical protein